MFEVSKFDMSKFVHTFIQNLGFRIESHACMKFNKITFITNIDKSYRIKEQLLYSAEKMKEINMQQDLNFSNEKNIQYFMEKHANLFEKLTYSNNAKILTSHLKNINMKILQKIRMRRKHNESMKKGEIKTHNKLITSNKKLKTNLSNKLNEIKSSSLSSMGCKQKLINFYTYRRNKYKKVAAFENSELLCHDTTTINDHNGDSTSEIDNDKQKIVVRHSSLSSIINMANNEIGMTEKFLSLYIKDIEYMKRNVQVTLHLAKISKYNHNARDQMEYNRVLCHHAILCLIEPSKKGIVSVEDDLSVVIQKYLLHGYKYHFEFQRGSKEYCTALLILSQWAKVLVKHINTTMMHTICGVLGCDVEKILVLYNPRGK